MGIEQPIEKSNPDKSFSLQDTNLMQADLIRRFGLDPLKWVRENAASFREIIESRPDLVELYRQDPEVAEEFIERRLNKKTLIRGRGGHLPRRSHAFIVIPGLTRNLL